MIRSFSLIACAPLVFVSAFALTPLQWDAIPAAEVAEDSTASVELDGYLLFFDPAAPRVLVECSQGDITLQLRPDLAPKTVANFLNYVRDGDYVNTIFHRSAPGFVIQTGGFSVREEEGGLFVDQVPTDDPIVNEFNASNIRGTIAMAKVGTGPDTATSQWFINLADNSENLNNQNGGFTVFGEVIDGGMEVADAIAALPRFDFSGSISAFDELPLADYDSNNPVTMENLVFIPAVNLLADDPADFPMEDLPSLDIVANSNSELLGAALDGRLLVLTPTGNGTGEVTLTLRASGDDESVETELVVTVTEGAPDPVLTDVFTEATETGGGWWYTQWYGFINGQNWPWIYSLEHGWQYVVPAGADSMWLWDASPELGWMWTANGIFPSFFHVDTGQYIIYASDNPEYGWYYFPAEQSWMQIN